MLFSLTAQQPENNITRTAYQAMAAVLGGTQSLHTNSMDETLALPSEKAVEIALRTQQVLAFETGICNVVDPLGGSWYVEELTDSLENEANDYFEKINDMGGVINGIELGYFQKEIADASVIYNNKVENKERIIVGLNDYIKEDEKIEIPILEIDESVQNTQINNLKMLRKNRDNKKVDTLLKKITNASKRSENLIPLIIDAALEYATLGEIVDSMKKVFGEWKENSII